MKVLVTGGLGFIGSNLIDCLLAENHGVSIIDDRSSGKISNVSHVIENVGLIESRIENVNIQDLGEIDAVVHLAAQVSVPLSISNFKESTTTNVLGTINVIDYCSKNKVPLVYASSSAIYGGLPMGDDRSEDVDLISPYAADKYAMELYATAAHNVYGLSSVGLRFFNVYGPRQDPSSQYSGVISIFIDRLLKNDSIYINGGYQTRDFIYVNDVVNCIYRSLLLSKNDCVCTSLNVLTGISVTIDELALRLSTEIGIEPKIIYRELPIGDPERSNGTIEKMCATLGVRIDEFKNLSDGLRETVSYIVSEYNR